MRKVNLRRLFVVFFLVFLCFDIAFSSSYLTYQGDETYFISDPQPTIKYEIISSIEKVFLHKAYLYLIEDDGSEVLMKEFSTYDGESLDQAVSRNYSFYFNDVVLENSKKYKFFFNITDEQGLDKSFLGDQPSYFFLSLDTSPVNITNYQDGEVINLIGINENEVMFMANKKIKKFTIIGQDINDNNNIFFTTSQSNYEEQTNFNNFNDYFSFSTVENSVVDGSYNLGVSIEDLYGNTNNYNFILNKNEQILEVFPISKRENENLKYYFNKDFPEFENFYEGAIYVDEKPFDFVVGTNKNANCFFSNQLTAFTQDDFLQEYLSFESIGGGEHRISALNFVGDETRFEVYCKSGAEKSYLNDYFNLAQTLLAFKFYDEDLEILDYSPKADLLSTSQFTSTVQTNIKAYCEGSLDGSNVLYFTPDADFLNHQLQINNLGEGNHIFNISCFSLTGEEERVDLNFRVENLVSEIIEDYSPRYTSSSTTNVNLILRENAECKYSLEEVDIASSYENLPSVENVGELERRFSVNLENDGENNVYIYCQKSGGSTILTSSISIYYDADGVSGDEIYFVNKVRRDDVKSNYVASNRELVIGYDFNSTLDIDRYNISIFNSEDSDVLREYSTSEKFNINSDKNVSSVSVIAQNEAGSYDELSIDVLLDLQSPSVDVQIDEFDNLNLVCQDAQSGCHKVFYGFSTTINENCFRETLFNSNVHINENYVYLCGVAFDKVGNSYFFNKTLKDGWFPNTNISINDSQNNISDNSSDIDDNKDTDKDGIPDWWEIENGLDPNDPTDANEDNDNDGFTNLEEYENGTDPNDANSPGSNNDGQKSNETSNNNGNPYVPPVQESESNTWKIVLLILLIIILILIVVGYYLYQKGYLDEYLEKFGVKKPKNNYGLNKNIQYRDDLYQRQVGSRNNVVDKDQHVFENHVDRAKRYVDEKNKELENLLKDFEKDESKLKTSIKSSLKNKSKKKIKTVDDLEDFEEIYGKGGKLSHLDFEDEANKFEKYYKEKKVNPKNTKKDKDKKDKKGEEDEDNGEE